MKKPTNDIDWDRVRQRLEASNHAMALALAPDEAVTAAIRKQRAAYLAARSGHEAKSSGLPVLIFTLEDEGYAIGLEHLAEISGSSACTPVPGMGDAILGLISLHDEIRPVLDLVFLLGVPRNGAASRKPGAVLFLRHRKSEIGVAVDRLERLDILDPEQLQAASFEGAGMPRKFISAITKDTLAVIDVPALLAGAGIGLEA
ncbi:MAG: chemotaxis protein CheW [Rhodospirillales bacterium]|nr:MAG: chemotaxis protein CheW [Rhodospirillales bacterium]